MSSSTTSPPGFTTSADELRERKTRVGHVKSQTASLLGAFASLSNRMDCSDKCVERIARRLNSPLVRLMAIPEWAFDFLNHALRRSASGLHRPASECRFRSHLQAHAPVVL